jgi:response regulator RpfG family c-di-GMP phosphodiesterase
MNLNGQIVIIDDDNEDIDIITEVMNEVLQENEYTNEILTFNNGEDVLEFLKDTPASPFLIMSDINMPRIDGFEIRQRIFDNPSMREKCVPYVFLTTAGDNEDFMRKSYEQSIQGYFKKPNDYRDYKTLFTDIIRYWKVAKLANRI